MKGNLVLDFDGCGCREKFGGGEEEKEKNWRKRDMIFHIERSIIMTENENVNILRLSRQKIYWISLFYYLQITINFEIPSNKNSLFCLLTK